MLGPVPPARCAGAPETETIWNRSGCREAHERSRVESAFSMLVSVAAVSPLRLRRESGAGRSRRRVDDLAATARRDRVAERVGAAPRQEIARRARMYPLAAAGNGSTECYVYGVGRCPIRGQRPPRSARAVTISG